jgi:Ca2+-binding EF-hand superfamily protein
LGNIAELGQSFLEFYQSDKLQKAALTAVASQITGDQIDALREQFHLIDKDGNGVITKDELVQAFEAAPPSKQGDIRAWAEALFEQLDSDGSGEIEFTEWEAAALRSFTEISDSAMLAAFRTIDVDDTGNISLDNLRRLIQVDNEELTDIMARADLNGDGVIDFEEFKAVFSTLAPHVSGTPLAMVQKQEGDYFPSPRSPLGTTAMAATAVKRDPSNATPRFDTVSQTSANKESSSTPPPAG